MKHHAEAAPNSGRGLFFRLITGLARKEWLNADVDQETSAQRRSGPGAFETVDPKSQVGYYKTAIHKLIFGSRSGTYTWGNVLTNANIDVDLNVIFAHLKRYINPARGTAAYGEAKDGLSTARANGLLVFSDSTKQPGTRYQREGAPDTPAGFFVSRLIDQSGSTAYIPSENDLGLNISDLYSGSTEEHTAAQAILVRDVRQIIRGMERSIGFQAVQRKVVKDLTGVEGLDFKVIINHLKERMSENSAGHGMWHRTTKEQLRLNEKEMKHLKRGLQVLERKIDILGGVASRFGDNENLGTQRIADILGTATIFAWQKNLNLANLTTENVSSVMMSLATKTNSVRLVADMFYVMMSGMAELTRPLSKLGEKGVLRTALGTLYDLDHSARTEGVETDVMNPNKNVLGKAFGWSRRWSQMASMRNKVALHRESARYVRDKMSKLKKLKPEILKLENSVMLRDVKKAIKNAGVRLSTVQIRAAMQSNLFGDKHLEILEGLFTKVNDTGRGFLKTPDIKSLIDFANNTEATGREIGQENTVELSNDLMVSRDDMRRSISVLLGFQKHAAELAVTTSDPLHMDTREHPIHWLIGVYRQFPLSLSHGAMWNQSALLPTHIHLMKLMQILISDVFYNMLLAVLGGWMTFEKLEEMYKNDKNQFVLTLLSYASRTPILGRQLGTSAQIVNNMANPEAIGGKAPLEGAVSTAALGERAIDGMYRNITRGIDDMKEGDTTSSLVRAKQYIMPFGDAAANMILGFVYPELAFPTTSRGMTNGRASSVPEQSDIVWTLQTFGWEDVWRMQLAEWGIGPQAPMEKNPNPSIIPPRKELIDEYEKLLKKHTPLGGTGAPQGAPEAQGSPPPSGSPNVAQTQPPAPSRTSVGSPPPSDRNRAINPIEAPEELT